MTALKPFPGQLHPKIKIEGEAKLVGTALKLKFEISGDVSSIRWPAPSASAQRRDELWKHTCFEAFIQPDGDNTYFEINLSPSGDWNVYRFNDYRQGMVKEERVTSALIDYKMISASEAVFKAEMPVFPATLDSRLSLTAVIEQNSGEISYWAIAHAGNEADFHLANSFRSTLR